MIDRLAVLGSGNMAQAFVRGFLKKYPATSVDMTCRNLEGRQKQVADLEKVTLSFGPNGGNEACLESHNLIILSLKPNQFAELSREWRKQKLSFEKNPDAIVISMMAGVSISDLKRPFPGWQAKFVRVATNTPASISQGAAAIFCPDVLNDHEYQTIMDCVNAVCPVARLVDNEKLINVATALVGSGPAFVWTFMEGLCDGAVSQGMTREMAKEFVTQMMIGSAQMTRESCKHWGQLRDEVASPGGTTIAGLLSLEENAFRSAASEAVIEASERANELEDAK